MFKVINGKSYNTETAELIASDCPLNVFPNDFNYWWQGLYRKKNGEYFMYDKESIYPYTESDARVWVEIHCEGAEYVEIFGEVPE